MNPQTAEEVLREVRKILMTPEGDNIVLHAEFIMGKMETTFNNKLTSNKENPINVVVNKIKDELKQPIVCLDCHEEGDAKFGEEHDCKDKQLIEEINEKIFNLTAENEVNRLILYLAGILGKKLNELIRDRNERIKETK